MAQPLRHRRRKGSLVGRHHGECGARVVGPRSRTVCVLRLNVNTPTAKKSPCRRSTRYSSEMEASRGPRWRAEQGTVAGTVKTRRSRVGVIKPRSDDSSDRAIAHQLLLLLLLLLLSGRPEPPEFRSAIGADFYGAMVATVPGEKLRVGRRSVRNWTRRTISGLFFLCRKLQSFLGKSTKTAATRAALFDSNMHQIVCRLWLRPRPHWATRGAYPAPPAP